MRSTMAAYLAGLTGRQHPLLRGTGSLGLGTLGGLVVNPAALGTRLALTRLASRSSTLTLSSRGRSILSRVLAILLTSLTTAGGLLLFE